MPADYRIFRDIIAARIGTIGNAGVVYNRQRYTSDWDSFLARFKVTIDGRQHLRGWWLERASRRVAVTDMDTQGSINWAHTFVIYGVLSFQDATDTDAEFGDLVDEVMSVLTDLAEAPSTLPGVWQIEWPRLRVQDFRNLGSVLCHYCEIVYIPHKQEAIG
jgi:hypothetical protein